MKKKNTNKKKFNVPMEGVLGLLAQGHKGIIAQRKARQIDKSEEKNQK